MIGTFGNIVFETTDKKILTFSNFSRQVSGRWKSTDTLRGKPVKEYLGDALRPIEAEDIRRAGKLMYVTAFLMLLVFGVAKLAVIVV